MHFRLLSSSTNETHLGPEQIKNKLTSDPRYDAVGSSSLREELFNTFLKAGASGPSAEQEKTSKDVSQPLVTEEDEAERERRRKEKKERAVKEREEKVRAERNKVEAEIDRSKLGLTREEGELEFRCAHQYLIANVYLGATHH